jgi:hypothetical protein
MEKIKLEKETNHFICKNYSEGHYFDILDVDSKIYFFYTSSGYVKLSINNKNTQFQEGINIVKCLENFFKVFYDNGFFYLFIGNHLYDKNKVNKKIPDLVFKKSFDVISDVESYSHEHNNGIYIMKSKNGIDWEYLIKKPVIHKFIESKSCPLGSCSFDTHPGVIKFNDIYHFYGRLNTNLDERLVFLIKSKDLIHWSNPIRLNIQNNECRMRPNYYHLCIFNKGNTLFSFIPYFEACGTNLRRSINGKTILYNSLDGINWYAVGKCLEHRGRYQHRVCSVLFNKSIKIYYRKNVNDELSEIVSRKIS